MADLPDISGLYADDEPTAQEAAAAYADALRRKEAAGFLAQLSGDPTLGQVGSSLLSSAQQGNEMIARASGQRLSRALQLQQANTEAEYRKAQLGIDQQRLDQGRWTHFADPASGAVYKEDQKTGNVVPVTSGGTAPGQPMTPRMIKAKQAVLDKLASDLDYTKGGSDIPDTAGKMIAAAQRIDTLLNSPGPFTNQRLHEIVQMAATVANGGHVPTQEQVNGQMPESFRSKGAEFWQKVEGIPVDIGMKEHLAQIRQQSENETQTAKKQIQDAFLRRLVKHPQAFQLYADEANRMAEGAGLKGLYDPKTLLALPPPPPDMPGELAPEKRTRLQELRRKAAEGTLAGVTK